MHAVIQIERSEREPVRPLVDKIGLVDNRRRARNVDVHMMVLKPGGSTDYHYHTESESVWIVLQGSAEAVIDGKEYRLEQNTVVFLSPNVRHKFRAVGNEEYRFIEIFSPPAADHVAAH